MLDKMKWQAGAISLLQSVDKAAMTIFEVLVDDFELAFELNLWASGLPLNCGCGVIAGVGIVRKNRCAAEEHEAGENRTAKD
jgi:hypothetical protein